MDLAAVLVCLGFDLSPGLPAPAWLTGWP